MTADRLFAAAFATADVLPSKSRKSARPGPDCRDRPEYWRARECGQAAVSTCSEMTRSGGTRGGLG